METNQSTENQLTPEELLADLKAKADLIGVSYSPNIGYDKLKAKVDEALAPKVGTASTVELTKEEEALAIRQNMTKLVRCIISSNDPAMREWDMTPYYSISNSLITLPKQTFPLNVEWHVPQAYVDMLESMTCGIPVKTKDEKGRSITVRKTIKKYNINVLPPLTLEELESLKAAQIMRDGL